MHKVHSKGEGLFDRLMRWIERFLTLMREGLSGLSNQPPISLEFLLPHTGSDRENILKEVDDVARYHYKLKLAYEAKVRRRFGRTQAGAGGGGDEADREDEAVASMVNDVVSDLSFGELVKGDADDLAAEATDEEEESDSDEDEDDSGDSEEGSSESESGEESSEEESSDDDGKMPTPIARSRTVGYSPHDTRPQVSPLYPGAHQKSSLDIPPTPSKSPIPSPIRSVRSMTISSPVGAASASSSSSFAKPLPPTPGQRQLGKQRERDREPKEGVPKKKKKPEGPKPPNLEHLPKLLPLFVEMVRHRSSLSVSFF